MDEDLDNKNKALSIRQAFLKHPTESAEVDFKDGIALTPKSRFCHKLVKHILGMANAGGGYIVIGFRENAEGVPEALPQLDKDVLSSYDVSDLAQIVEAHIFGSEKIYLKVHKDPHPDTGVIYPIIEISPFIKRPFFCFRTTSDNELLQGALYIRVASARTIVVASPDEWDKLIDQCVRAHHDELLLRFKSLIGEMGFTAPNLYQTATLFPERKFQDIDTVQHELSKKFEDAGIEREGLEILHYPFIEKKWSRPTLLDSLRDAKLRNTGWPIGIVTHADGDRPEPLHKGAYAEIGQPKGEFDYWYINENGAFYFFRRYEEDSQFNNPDRHFYFDVRLWRIIEAIRHTISLYKALSVDPTTMIFLQIKHTGLLNRILTASNKGRAVTMRTRINKTVPEVLWNKTVSLDDLLVNGDAYVAIIARELFETFGFWNPADEVITGIIKEFDKSSL